MGHNSEAQWEDFQAKRARSYDSKRRFSTGIVPSARLADEKVDRQY